MRAIIAISEKNRVIGNNGTIPWKCKEDLKWFKEYTMGQSLIVGRKTFDLLPALPGREILVLSRSLSNIITNDQGLVGQVINIPTGLEDAIVAGGKEVYQAYMPFINEMYVSYIKGEYHGDIIMPEFESRFRFSSTVKENTELKITRYYTNCPL